MWVQQEEEEEENEEEEELKFQISSKNWISQCMGRIVISILLTGMYMYEPFG